MARVEFDSFGKDEVARIYLAGRLSEAQGVEEVLTANGIDYYVEVEPYETYLLGIFPRRQSGVAFYVRASQAEQSKRILMDTRHRVGILDEEHH